MATETPLPTWMWLKACSTASLVLYLALITVSGRDAESRAACKLIRDELQRREWLDADGKPTGV